MCHQASHRQSVPSPPMQPAPKQAKRRMSILQPTTRSCVHCSDNSTSPASTCLPPPPPISIRERVDATPRHGSRLLVVNDFYLFVNFVISSLKGHVDASHFLLHSDLVDDHVSGRGVSFSPLQPCHWHVYFPNSNIFVSSRTIIFAYACICAYMHFFSKIILKSRSRSRYRSFEFD